MKLKAKIVSNKKGFLILETDIMTDFREGEFVRVEIKPYKSSRSLEQNSKLWALIQELADKTGNDTMDIYISALEYANAKYEWIACLEDAEDDLKKCFRAVKPYGTITTEKGKILIRYKCFIGSSKFDVTEMCTLIDFVERELYD